MKRVFVLLVLCLLVQNSFALVRACDAVLTDDVQNTMTNEHNCCPDKVENDASDLNATTSTDALVANTGLDLSDCQCPDTHLSATLISPNFRALSSPPLSQFEPYASNYLSTPRSRLLRPPINY